MVASILGADAIITDQYRVIGNLRKNLEANLNSEIHKFKLREFEW